MDDVIGKSRVAAKGSSRRHKLLLVFATATVYLLRAIIKLYQYTLSPFLSRNCRFYPSCSNYCTEALQRHGLWRGIRLGLWRILRCNPWYSWPLKNLQNSPCLGFSEGYDPVPEVWGQRAKVRAKACTTQEKSKGQNIDE